jgi:hypothetical protein
MSKVGAFLFGASFAAVSLHTYAAESCVGGVCKVGNTVQTTGSKNDWAFHCPTQGLSEYTNYVLGIWAMQSEVFGVKPDPNIDVNAKGETAQALAMFRRESGAKSFDEARKRCVAGKAGVKGKITEFPSGSLAMKIEPANGGAAFWTSEAHVIRIK